MTSELAADAFFSFADAPEILVNAGCCQGVVPSGGINFNLIKEFFETNNCQVEYLDEKMRGFCRH